MKSPINHTLEDIIGLFNQCFLTSHNTELVSGVGEPIYLPATETQRHHRIEFANGFYQSALHEIAHWCQAGEQRRQQVDYGYWYIGDGRNKQQQAAFETVEIKPQAIEWGLSVCCGMAFNVSSDNLDGAPVNRLAFQHQVYDQVRDYLVNGFPKRAQVLMQAMCRHYFDAKLEQRLTLEHFNYRGMYER
ncbi:elongation factor P hydroxylase [Paraferrimonas sedimenticola]|uniref:Transporting ATPase n=1 Tax=Paraferrimonas sedimenticola TaxID=375674 RepID=A0AA37RX88_9GAMM|nr:elongation factor P hydroxylase [Paraferrimonas sedimenticola]GLP96584.1 transporting ATPase [Paraferrimonas sedimenticola]